MSPARPPFPLAWPAGWSRTQFRRPSKFRVAGLAKSRDSILRQLRAMGGSHIVITSNLPVRADGLLYATAAEPGDPGIAVYWIEKGHERVMACDRWTRARDNLHAIELSISALRGLDRWGSSQIVERAFAGFAALPPGPDPAAHQPLLHWRTLLDNPRDLDDARAAYRMLSQEAHPDKGGSHEEMAALNRAWEEAQAHFGGGGDR